LRRGTGICWDWFLSRVGSISLIFLFLSSGWHCGWVVMLWSTAEYLKYCLNHSCKSILEFKIPDQFWNLKSQIWLCKPLQSWREVLQCLQKLLALVATCKDMPKLVKLVGSVGYKLPRTYSCAQKMILQTTSGLNLRSIFMSLRINFPLSMSVSLRENNVAQKASTMFSSYFSLQSKYFHIIISIPCCV
jgi:hypothetical protein